MLQTRNHTPFEAMMVPLPDQNGIDSVVTMIKGTFKFSNNKVSIAPLQKKIRLTDVFYGDPQTTSIKYASDISLPKIATDVVVTGSAYAPKGEPYYEFPVSLSLKREKHGKEEILVEKVLQIFGDREWEGIKPVITKSKTKPLTKMPLIYENAYGGTVFNPKDSTEYQNEPRNPVGKGFYYKKWLPKSDSPELPNIEDPDNLITKYGKQPERIQPAGFGYIAPHWQQRVQYAGTYDDNWKKTRAPYLAKDFSPKFLNTAHPDLIMKGYLKGGEVVSLQGLHPDGDFTFTLPTIKIRVEYYIDGKTILNVAPIDTLFFEPDENELTYIWRSSETCDKKTLKVAKAEVHVESSDINLELA